MDYHREASFRDSPAAPAFREMTKSSPMAEFAAAQQHVAFSQHSSSSAGSSSTHNIGRSGLSSSPTQLTRNNGFARTDSSQSEFDIHPRYAQAATGSSGGHHDLHNVRSAWQPLVALPSSVTTASRLVPQPQPLHSPLRTSNKSMQSLWHPYGQPAKDHGNVSRSQTYSQQPRQTPQSTQRQSLHRPTIQTPHQRFQKSPQTPQHIPGPLRRNSAQTHGRQIQQQRATAKHPLAQTHYADRRPVAVVKEPASKQQTPTQPTSNPTPPKTITPLPPMPQGKDYLKVFPFTQILSIDDLHGGMNAAFRPAECCEDVQILKEGSTLTREEDGTTLSTQSHIFGIGYGTDDKDRKFPAPDRIPVTQSAASSSLTASLQEMCPPNVFDNFLKGNAPTGTPAAFVKHNLNFRSARAMSEDQQKVVVIARYKTVRSALNALARARFWTSAALDKIAKQKKVIESKMEKEFGGTFTHDEDGVLAFEFCENGEYHTHRAASFKSSTGSHSDEPLMPAFASSSPVQDLVNLPLGREEVFAVGQQESKAPPYQSPATSPVAESQHQNMELQKTEHITNESPLIQKSTRPGKNPDGYPPSSPSGHGAGPKRGNLSTASPPRVAELWHKFIKDCYVFRVRLCHTLNETERHIWVAFSNGKRPADMPQERILHVARLPNVDLAKVMNFLQHLNKEKATLEELGIIIVQRMKDMIQDTGKLKAIMDMLAGKRLPFH